MEIRFGKGGRQVGKGAAANGARVGDSSTVGKASHTAEATITSKGPITVPKKVRKALKCPEGRRIGLVIDERGQVTVRLLRAVMDRLRGTMKHLVKRPLSIEEMNEAILQHRPRTR